MTGRTDLKLLTVLFTTSTLLAHSSREGFGFEEPHEAREQIDQIIGVLFFDADEPLPEYWQVLFAPTGPLQEVSIANGWAEVYIKLSSEFDRLQYLIKEHEGKREQSRCT